MIVRLAALCLAAFLATLVFAQPRTFLPKPEVESLAMGKQWIHLRTTDQRKILWDLRSGGRLYARGFIGSQTDSGTWMVNNEGQLCVKWRGNSTDRCVALLKDGEKLLMVDSNDLAGTYGELTIE